MRTAAPRWLIWARPGRPGGYPVSNHDVLTLTSKRQNTKEIYAQPYPGYCLFLGRYIQGSTDEGRRHSSFNVGNGE
jgi:hypothetical protein